MDLAAEFGDIDIYVFDQLLRGRIVPAAGRHGETSPKPGAASPEGRRGVRVFDAGCGGGRNLVYLLRNGFDVCGNDIDPGAVARVRAMAAAIAPGAKPDFRVEAIEDTSFPPGHADVVLASAVLHFAMDDAHFEAMLRAMWRTLQPGGLFFARLASTIGIADQVTSVGNGSASAADGRYGEVSPITHAGGSGRYRLPDGSDRYLVDAETIQSWTEELGGRLVDPIKTTVVHQQRSMTTWVARRL